MGCLLLPPRMSPENKITIDWEWPGQGGSVGRAPGKSSVLHHSMKKLLREGSIAQWLAYLLPDPGLIPSIPKKFLEENIVDDAEVYPRRCLEESKQWL